MTSANSTTYDDVPYSSYPYRQSHPDRLATVATLFGMQPTAIRKCDVLELGCAAGGNLMPLADQFPESKFVGIDLSQVQVAEGQRTIEALGLENIKLLHKSILDVDEQFGKFDYILCHGVFSWVPDAVQDKILSICRDHLTTNGVAYISYNVYPGWHMRGMIRDIMCYRAQAFSNPSDQVKHARALLDFLAQTVPSEENSYGILLKKELNLLRGKEDHYLLHEHLEEFNEPVYFHEFAERAKSKDLQYLGEADFSVMSVRNFPQHVEAMLQTVASDLIQIEQYMDFVRNRMFRQTLLCHKEVSLDRSLAPQRISSLHIASPARPEQSEIDIKSPAQVTFRGPHAVTTTSDPLVKAAFLHLMHVWPETVPFGELLATARSQVDSSAAVVDSVSAARDGKRLAEPLIRCYSTSQVELSTLPCAFVATPPERPATTQLVRFQARNSHAVTNLRHETVTINDLERHVLLHLTGEHDRSTLISIIEKLVGDGVLVVRENGKPIQEQTTLNRIVSESLDQTLQQLAKAALLARKH